MSTPTLQAMRPYSDSWSMFSVLPWMRGPTALIKASGARGLSRDGDYAQTKRFLIDRVVDRGHDHSDYRRDRYPEPAAGTHCGQRGLLSKFDPKAYQCCKQRLSL